MMQKYPICSVTCVVLALALPAGAAPTTTPPSAMSLFQSAVTRYMAARSSEQAWLMDVKMGQMGTMRMYMHQLRSGTRSRNDMSMRMTITALQGLNTTDKKQVGTAGNSFNTTVFTYTSPQNVTVYTPATNSYFVEPISSKAANLFAPDASQFITLVHEFSKDASQPDAFVVKPGKFRGQRVWWVAVNPMVFEHMAMKAMATSKTLLAGKSSEEKPDAQATPPAPTPSSTPPNMMGMFSGMFKSAHIAIAFARRDDSFMGMHMQMQVPGIAQPITAVMRLVGSKTNVDIPATELSFVPPKNAKKVEGFAGMMPGMIP